MYPGYNLLFLNDPFIDRTSQFELFLQLVLPICLLTLLATHDRGFHFPVAFSQKSNISVSVWKEGSRYLSSYKNEHARKGMSVHIKRRI